ncbi:MAG: diguanylate cyclase [Clostridiales bacterium 43-6]|nr:MAG: diguanylate cyclase [Clostridiales bacterium 43-6]
MVKDSNNLLKINQVLYLVKFASLFFSAMAFFQYYYQNESANNIYSFGIFAFIILVILLLYIFWDFLWSKKIKYKFLLTWIQPLVFISFSTVAILLTGSYESNYKFLFMFIIISSTIESGFKLGITTSSVCSLIILSLDLILVKTHNSINSYFGSDLVLVGAFLILAYTIGIYVKTEKEHIEELKDRANIDGLTNLYNHRYFYDAIAKAIKESDENKTSLSLLFIDIDYFKYYNDLHGHQKGDEVLKIIARVLKSSVREKDLVARYGGEEFAVMLPDTVEDEAIEIAENLRLKIQNVTFEGQEYQPNENLTISLGVSVYPQKAKTETELIKFADEALYRAKFLRKNRVEGYSSIFEDLQGDLDKDDREVVTSIKTLIAVINARDKYTYGHVERVVAYCKILAEKLDLCIKDNKNLIYGAYMHDVGKINISKEILVKNTPLTPTEWDELKEHPQNAIAIIKNVKALNDVIPIILQHHEKLDGTGYPFKLEGDNINYLAKVLSVADSFDAMTSDRPYHRKKSISEGIEELRKCGGSQFDPEIVEKFIEAIKENMNHL